MKPWFVLCSLPWFAAFAAPADPAFEVASIKPAQSMPMGKMMTRMNTDAGMLRYTNVSLKDCIRAAYRVKDFQVQGPDWLSSARFDIVAKFPDGASESQVPEMLQALLAERFKLKLHRETKEHAIYALVAAKGGPKLKPAEVEVPTGDKRTAVENPAKGAPPRGGMMMMRMDPSGMHLKAAGATLANLAEAISRFSERPVVDMTGIQGQYDFELVFLPETTRGVVVMRGGAPQPDAGDRPPADAPSERAGSIYESVRAYGLRLEPRKAPMEILTVDQIEKTPTEN